jgi:D-sedoheptulose 7-phosphate isomerase
MFDTRRYLEDYLEVLRRLDDAGVERIAGLLFDAWRAGRTVFCCGNGGSAASAMHFTMDLTKLTAPARGRRLRAMALTESVSAMTAIGNDIAYEEVFAEQLRAFLSPGDVVLGFSTSGSSPNVLRAIEFANEAGATTVGVTGRTGTTLGTLAHHTVYVDSTSVQHVEDATMVVVHLLCLRVKELIAHASEAGVTAAERDAVLGAPAPAGATRAAVASDTTAGAMR